MARASQGRFEPTKNHDPSRVTLVVAAALAAVALSVITLLAIIAPRGVPTVKYYDLKMLVADSDDIRLLSPVYISGRRVGQVTKISHTSGRSVQLDLQLQGREGPLRSDTTARVRIKNPVGAKEVELTPGLAGDELPSGAVIAADKTSNATDLVQVLSTFGKPTRGHLQDGLKGLGQGFVGRGDEINRTLTKTPSLLPDLDAVSRAVLARDGAARRFAPSAETLAGAYDPVRDDLAKGFAPQGRVLDAFGDSSSKLRGTLDVSPSALAGLKRGLDQARPLLAQTTRLALASRRLTAVAPGALRQTTRLLDEARPALVKTKPALSELRTAVSPTLSLLRATDPVIAPSIKVLVNQQPLLTQLAAYGCDVRTMTTNWRDALSFGVPTGGDPTSDLDKAQDGLGPNMNSFRVLSRTPLTGEDLNPDGSGGRNPNRDATPAPCVAKGQRAAG